MKILVYGDFTIDRYREVSSDRFCPEQDDAPVYDLGHLILERLGCAGNTLQNVLALKSLFDEDVEVSIGGAIGSGALSMVSGCSFSRFLNLSKDIIKERFVYNDRILCRVDSRKTFHPIDDMGAMFYAGPDKDYDLLIVSDYCFGGVNKEDVQHLIDNSKVSVVDTKRHRDISIFRGASYFKFNEHEFSNHKFADILQLPSKGIVVSRGKEGCKIIHTNPNMYKEVEPFRVDKEVDVTGCGDTFTSAFAMYVAKTDEPYMSAYRANYLASRVVTRMGPSVPSLDEISNGKKIGVL